MFGFIIRQLDEQLWTHSVILVKMGQIADLFELP